jgi:hypothetical protein
MSSKAYFEAAPLSIDYFISYPGSSKIVSSPYCKLALLLLSLYLLAIILMRSINKQKAIIHCISLSVSVLTLVISVKLTPFIDTARNPNASTIVAGMVDDKRALDFGLFKQ